MQNSHCKGEGEGEFSLTDNIHVLYVLCPAAKYFFQVERSLYAQSQLPKSSEES